MRNARGFTVIELLLGISIFIILLGIVTLNLNTAKTQTSLSATVETLTADLSQQQLKAMIGDTEGRTTSDTYGIHFDTDSYTLFHGTYSVSESTNFSINMPDTQQVTTEFPGDQIIFEQGSGEIVGYNENDDTIIIQDTQTNQQRVLELNKFGVITAVN
jgi:type II secretory pathway pseudopilin PulG